MRRIVTGLDADGQPTIVSAEEPPRSTHYRHVPGMVDRLVWATDPPFRSNPQGRDPTVAVSSVVPEPGGTRLTVVTFPPDTVFAAPDFDPAAAAKEHAQASPGLAECFDPDDPGMHESPTVDYAILLQGSLFLDLGPGGLTALQPGDVVVQNGVRHGWRNQSDEPATMAFVLIGCDNAGGA